MCRAGRSAHGSPFTGNRRSRRVPESCGKLGVDPRGRPSPMCNTTARAGKSSLTEAPLPSDEAAPPQPAREDRTLGPAGRGASAAPPHGPGRTRPARQRPSAPAPRQEPEPHPNPAEDRPHRTHPGPRTPDPDGKGPLGPFAMSRGSLPGRPRCDTTTPRPRPLRRRRQRPCFRRPSRGPPRVPGPGSGGAHRPAGPGLKDTSGMLVPSAPAPPPLATGRPGGRIRHFPAAPTRTGRSRHADATARSWDRRPARTGRRRAR